MSYQEQQKKVQAERQERERRKVEDDLEQQHEQARKASALDEVRSNHHHHSHREPSPEPLVLADLDRHLSFSSLSMAYEQNRTVGNPVGEVNANDRLGIQRSQWRRQQSMQTSPLDFDNASFLTSSLDDRYADDTTIPFFDDDDDDDQEQLSNDTTSKSPSRHDSRVDNDSIQTVRFLSSSPTHQPSSRFFQLCPHVTYGPAYSRSDSVTTSTRSKSTLTFTSSNTNLHVHRHLPHISFHAHSH